jgi:DNA-directed RNA polymerase III subunit RPC1
MNGMVKKFGALRIVHEKYRNIGAQKDLAIERTQFERSFSYAISVNPDVQRHLHRAIDNIDPLICEQLFDRIALQVYLS